MKPPKPSWPRISWQLIKIELEVESLNQGSAAAPPGLFIYHPEKIACRALRSQSLMDTLVSCPMERCAPIPELTPT